MATRKLRKLRRLYIGEVVGFKKDECVCCCHLQILQQKKPSIYHIHTIRSNSNPNSVDKCFSIDRASSSLLLLLLSSSSPSSFLLLSLLLLVGDGIVTAMKQMIGKLYCVDDSAIALANFTSSLLLCCSMLHGLTLRCS